MRGTNGMSLITQSCTVQGKLPDAVVDGMGEKGREWNVLEAGEGDGELPKVIHYLSDVWSRGYEDRGSRG